MSLGWRLALAAGFISALFARGIAPLNAQQPGRPQPARTDTTTRRDTSAAKDTLAKANFAPPDSVMQRLLNLPGYTVTRYKAEDISFDAVTRALLFVGSSVVQRDSQIVK